MPSAALIPQYVAKPWGRRDSIPAPEDAQPLGEVIFRAENIIIKWLQTSESLSIQVHPQNEGRKHEWWYVTKAEPGAFLYLGLMKDTTTVQLKAAALDGSLTKLLNRIEPKVGDSFMVESGTIHALGPGLTIVEVQETSDITWRLYDYGRPRELHLEQALKEAILNVQPVKPLPDRNIPFLVEYITVKAGEETFLTTSSCCLIIVDGAGVLDGHPYAPYQCFEIAGGYSLAATKDTEIIRAAVRSNIITQE